MKKAAIFNVLNINNHGDRFIADCVKYLAENEQGFSADIYSLEPFVNPLIKLIYLGILFISKLLKGKELKDKLVLSATIIRCKKYYRKTLSSYDAVIIGGGSFKYGTQKVWAEYSVLIDVAEELNLPVMFNAVNIQKYDPSSWKCKYLTKHASKPNVRMITSRDGDFGVKRLREEYKIPDRIICAGVGDPAFWIPDCYNIARTECNETVGINIINGKNYRLYGGTRSEEEIVDFYCGLLKKLDEKNIRWELFTNGIQADYLFGKRILQKYGQKGAEIYIPVSAKDTVDKIASYKVILGARLHACICAYSLDVPFIGLNWDEKILHFSEMSETEELFFSEDQLDAEIISEKIECLLRQGYQFSAGNRDYWKEKTRSFLCEYLRSV